ncbi:selenium cofactor biosynthesis protein YqeC [Haloglomus halophilum]|uniref:selenium cofactor biosynthesis protein YqeC n=1 Tax=Haloglomus halophilum TaxID=2962672 RepID=UPI0020C94B24|nr:selenium cofactor biosynthesis protein YqeC [Haloglomus halophilum]
MDLVEALAVDGLVCVVGAGGKKTTLYTLADRLDRAVVTATTRIPAFPGGVARLVETTDPIATVRAAGDTADEWPLGLVPEWADDVRYEGYDAGTVAEVARVAGERGVHATLVKADGARGRWLKAPADHEPVIPAATDTVVPIASARVVGEPLDEEHVHRPERVAAVTGRAVGAELTADDVAAVLASPDGGLRNVPDEATVVALVNMVDDDALRATAEEIAAGVLARNDRVARVVTARMDEPRVVATFE